MLTRFTTAALAITLLGASAYGLAPLEPVTSPVASLITSAVTSAEQPSGLTVIEKNSAWPLKTRMSMDPCTVRICQEA